MSKKLLIISATIIISTLLSTTVSAMKINLTLDNTINNKVNFGFHLYYNEDNTIHEDSYSTEGVAVENLWLFMSSLNNILSDIDPINSITGEPSTISLGYINADGAIVKPATCTNIVAKPDMSIFMNEGACIVS